MDCVVGLSNFRNAYQNQIDILINPSQRQYWNVIFFLVKSYDSWIASIVDKESLKGTANYSFGNKN